MANDYTKSISWEPSADASRQPASTNLARALSVSPLVASLLVARGITTPDAARAFLDPQHYHPAPPEALPDLAAATALLHETVRRRQPILVWGDFDVDGQTATALLVTALRSLGATVAYYIPSRLEESHGVHRPALAEQIKKETAVGDDHKLTRDQLAKIMPVLQYLYKLQARRAFDRVVTSTGAYGMEEKFLVTDDPTQPKKIEAHDGQQRLRSFLEEKRLLYHKDETLDPDRFVDVIVSGATPLAQQPDVTTVTVTVNQPADADQPRITVESGGSKVVTDLMGNKIENP